MAEESKVQKVSRKEARKSNPGVVGKCSCGGDIMHAKVIGKGMRKVCMACGDIPKLL